MLFDHFSKYLAGNEHFEKNCGFLSQLNISIFDQKMMVSTAGRKTQLHRYWWSYGWIGFCSYDSGTMAYSDYSTSAVVRVRASSPAWRYHYNIRLYSIDFRWVYIKFWITSFWGFGRAARSGDAMSQSDYAMSPVSSIQWYFKCNIIDDFHGVLPGSGDIRLILVLQLYAVVRVRAGSPAGR